MKRTILAVISMFMAQTANAQDAPAAGNQDSLNVSLMSAVVIVDQIDKELEYYTKILGMKLGVTNKMGGTRQEYILHFSDNPTQAGLTLVHDSAAPPTEASKRGPGLGHLDFRVSDLDVLARRLDAAHITYSPIRDVGHGVRVMISQDPDGNRFELVQVPAQIPAQK